MSQQKQLVVLALGLLGLVAMVSAQSFDFQTCQKNGMSAMSTYQKTIVKAMREFASSMQDVGENAADTSAFNSEMNELVAIWSNVVQGSNFDAGRVSSAYIQSMQKMQSIMVIAFRTYSSAPQSSMTSYMKFAQTMFSAQSTLMTSISSGCMPTFRRALSSQ